MSSRLSLRQPPLPECQITVLLFAPNALVWFVSKVHVSKCKCICYVTGLFHLEGRVAKRACRCETEREREIVRIRLSAYLPVTAVDAKAERGKRQG